jgi:hypothetical protein
MLTKAANTFSKQQFTLAPVNQPLPEIANSPSHDMVEKRRHLAVYRRYSYDDLTKLIGTSSMVEVHDPSCTEYQIEIDVMWDSPREKVDIRVMGMIDYGRHHRPTRHSHRITPGCANIGTIIARRASSDRVQGGPSDGIKLLRKTLPNHPTGMSMSVKASHIKLQTAPREWSRSNAAWHHRPATSIATNMRPKPHTHAQDCSTILLGMEPGPLPRIDAPVIPIAKGTKYPNGSTTVKKSGPKTSKANRLVSGNGTGSRDCHMWRNQNTGITKTCPATNAAAQISFHSDGNRVFVKR